MSESKARTLVWNESLPASHPSASAARPVPFAELDRRASEFLALVPWDGPSPDAVEMPAREFLAWL